MSGPAVVVLVTLVTAVVAAVRGTWSPCGLSMVSAINPFSEASRGYRYPVTCGLFALGSTAAGAAVGAVAALGAAALSPAVDRLPVVAGLLAVACAVVCLAAELGVRGVRLPLHPRQVDELWLGRYRRWVYATGFGAQVGLGFATYVMSAATYLFVALGVLSGDPPLALASGAAFGLVRGLAVTLTARAVDPGRLRALHRRLDALTAPSVAVARAWLAVAVVLLGVAVAGPLGGVVAAVVVLALLAAGARVLSRSRQRVGAISRSKSSTPLVSQAISGK